MTGTNRVQTALTDATQRRPTSPTFPQTTGHPDDQSPGRRSPSRTTSPNAARPKQSMPSPGGQISRMTGHQRERGRAGCGQGGASRRPPPGLLPRGDPGAEPHEAAAGRVEGCPRAASRSGYARSTGCPTAPSVQDHPWSSGGRNASRPPTRPRTSRHGRSAKRSGRQM
jgi:hypothetical protein